MSVLPPAFHNPPSYRREPNPRFEEFRRSLERHGIEYNDPDEVEKRVGQAFPDIRDQIAYYKWYASPIRNQPDRATVPRPSPDEYVDHLKNTFYTNHQRVWWLLNLCWLPYRPVIIVRTSKGLTYKVSICTPIEGRIALDDKRELMPEHPCGNQ